uniref:NADH-ubiquinone oxidoreductase chain 2 n=1 Tax=Gasteruption parvicollarium TaxID=1738629 RepID=A0A2S0B8J9_9HYME|nr:NADH dehydrogenase subunit 2 [Gasteruption parvicollarium]ALJ93752.1 NADH dehydrogenase subunit 2 [Gasteruption parvicollarium]
MNYYLLNNINYMLFMFIMMLILSILFSLTFLNMLGVYMMMELNLISYLPLLIFYNNNFKTEIVFIYFIIQSLSSMMFLLSIIFMMFLMENINIGIKVIEMLYMFSLLIKLGCAPFHFWYMIMMKYMSWMNCYLLSTVQKIMPMIFMYQFKNNLIYLVIFLCSFVSFFSLNEVSLRMIMAYSSINHLGWMLMSIIMNFFIWFLYFIIYSIILYFLMNMFNMYYVYYINQLQVFIKMKYIMYFFSLLMFSLGGMPPFLGFYMKWFVMELFLNNMVILIYLFMIIGSMMMLFNYIRLIYVMFLFYKDENLMNMFFFYFNNFNNYKFFNILILYMSFFLMMLSLIFLM